MITTVGDLTEEGIYDHPKEDYDGHFLYVSAKDGHDTDSTTLATPMLDVTVTGCLQFYFNIYVRTTHHTPHTTQHTPHNTHHQLS